MAHPYHFAFAVQSVYANTPSRNRSLVMFCTCEILVQMLKPGAYKWALKIGYFCTYTPKNVSRSVNFYSNYSLRAEYVICEFVQSVF